MIKKIMLASCLLVASMASQAALISYNGYERDTAKNYVTGGGLEWLKWDETKGSSIEAALSTHASQGWRLASNLEMAELFNNFQFSSTVFGNNENISQNVSTPWSTNESGVHTVFLSLFGTTSIGGNVCTSSRSKQCYAENDNWIASAAIFGADLDGDLNYNYAFVVDDRTYFDWSGYRTNEQHEVMISSDYIEKRDGLTGVGVALVRVSNSTSVAVPTPGPIGLLALGLVALGYRRRQVLGR